MESESHNPQIYRIPDELLLKIFENAAPSGSRRETLASARDAVRLSHVSSRFRSVAIDTPALWSVVSNKQSKELRAMFLTRSKFAELRVFLLLVDRGTDDYVNFLADVLPLSDRWKEFYFRTGAQLTDYIRIIQKLSNLCSGLILPRLIDFTLVYPNPTMYETDGSGLDEYFGYIPGADLFHFYKTWTTPQLKKLRARNLIPLRTGSLEMDTCEIKLRSSGSAEWHVKVLESLATTWVNLKVLTFSVGIMAADEVVPPLHLPELVILSLQLDREDWDGFTGFMDALHIPNIKSMELTSLSCYLGRQFDPPYRTLNECVKALFPAHEEYQGLRSLSVSLGEIIYNSDDASPSRESDEVLTIIFSRLSNLHHVTLDIPDLEPPQTSSALMPPLRTLTIRNNKHIDIDFVSSIIDELRKGEDWDAFTSLTIEDCAKLERGQLEGILPEDMVTWVSKPGSQSDGDPERTDSEPEYDWSKEHAKHPDEIWDELYEETVIRS